MIQYVCICVCISTKFRSLLLHIYRRRGDAIIPKSGGAAPAAAIAILFASANSRQTFKHVTLIGASTQYTLYLYLYGIRVGYLHEVRLARA